MKNPWKEQSIPLTGKMCGTCLYWDHAAAINKKSQLIAPSARADCTFASVIEHTIRIDFPACYQKTKTVHNDGTDCACWRKSDMLYYVFNPVHNTYYFKNEDE